MNKSSVFILLILIGFCFIASAQVELKKRIEFEIRDGYGDEEIIPFKELGVLVKSKRNKALDQMDEWRYQWYDTALNLVEERTFELHASYAVDVTYHSDDHLFTLFRNRRGEYVLMNLEAETLDIKSVKGQFERRTYISDMAISGNYAYFKGANKREKFILSLDLSEEIMKKTNVKIPNYKVNNTLIYDFQIIPATNELFVFAKGMRRKTSEIHVLSYDSVGEKNIQTHIDKNLDQNLNSIAISRVSEGKYAFTGTYSSKSQRSSEGLYFGLIENEERKNIRFYNFLDLENFLNFLPERTADRIRKKKKRRASGGKELTMNYFIESHPVLYKNNKYIFLGEAYFPTYETEFYTTTVNGRTVTQTREVFDGFQYTHAIVAAFNEEAEILWDNIFEMWPSLKPMRPIRFISAAEDKEESLDLVFSSHNKIKTKSFNYEGVILKDSSSVIETEYEDDKVRSSNTKLVYWYEGYFINYGVQTIKNVKDEDVKRKRRVYFISKIGY